MTTLIDDNRARVVATPNARYFYFYMALACIAVAFLGFAPTYWLRWRRGRSLQRRSCAQLMSASMSTSAPEAKCL
jgi:hypothetical protein